MGSGNKGKKASKTRKVKTFTNTATLSNNKEVDQISITVRTRQGVNKVSSTVIEKAIFEYLGSNVGSWLDYCIDNQMKTLN